MSGSTIPISITWYKQILKRKNYRALLKEFEWLCDNRFEHDLGITRSDCDQMLDVLKSIRPATSNNIIFDIRCQKKSYLHGHLDWVTFVVSKTNSFYCIRALTNQQQKRKD